MPLRITYETWVQTEICGKWQVLVVFACSTKVYDTSLALINYHLRGLLVLPITAIIFRCHGKEKAELIYESTCHTLGNNHLTNEVAHSELAFSMLAVKLLPSSADIHGFYFPHSACHLHSQRHLTSYAIKSSGISSLLFVVCYLLLLLLCIGHCHCHCYCFSCATHKYLVLSAVRVIIYCKHTTLFVIEQNNNNINSTSA